MYKTSKQKAFTLVELIVVVGVLSVLATISFSTVANISSGARDSARLTDISSIKTSLEQYNATKGGYPIPDNAVAITWSGNLAWSQGTFGDDTVRALNTISRPKDPKWSIDYSYSVANNKKEYEVATVLEKAISFNGLQKAYAQGEQYEPLIKGNYNGVVVKVVSSLSTWILSVPTIIASDIKDAKLENILFSYPKSKNVPFSYTGSVNSPQGAAANFGVKQVWSGATNTATALPKTDSELQQLTTDLKAAYTGSTASNNETIKSLLNTTDNKGYGGGIVNTVGGWITTGNSTPNKPILVCPTGYIVVPGDSAWGTDDFCVMKYEAKNVGGIATSQAAGAPWLWVTQSDSIAYCKSIGAGYHLITNNEWMTLSRNVEWVDSNWSNGAVGNGYLYNGHNSGSPAGAIDASTDDTNSLYGMGNTGNGASYNNKRTLTLSNGSVVWDLNGNVWEHVNKGNTVDGTGYNVGQTSVAGCSPSGSWAEWTSCSNKNWWPANASHNSNNGMGILYDTQGISSNIMLRGGDWNFAAYGGVFALGLNCDNSNSGNNVGFRCAK